MARHPLADAWVWRGMMSVLVGVACLPTLHAVTSESRISYVAPDQEVATLIAALGTFSGENIQADVDLLVAGINATRGSLRLVNAGPASCRQALAYALDCWWARGIDGSIVLTANDRLPRGQLDVRTLTSTLRRQAALQPMIEHFLAPWLGGQAGLSYLPAEGLWTATLDSDGHSRLIELLSLCERPLAQAIGRIADPAAPDLRRSTTVEWSARTWPALVDGLGEALQTSVALSARLRLRAFPVDVFKFPKMPMGELVGRLRASGIAASWSHGVLCLGELSQGASQRDREHPAQRRRMALIPIGHLVTPTVDGGLIAATIRRHVQPDWWSLPGAGIEYLSGNGCLLVAGDADVQQAVLDAVTAIDMLGMELGLAAITKVSVTLDVAR